MGRTKVWGGHFRQRRCRDSPRVWLERSRASKGEGARNAARGLLREAYQLSLSQSPGLQDRIQCLSSGGGAFLLEMLEDTCISLNPAGSSFTTQCCASGLGS